MEKGTAKLDHLVIAAHTLDQGTAYVRSCLGVAPSGGGKHVFMGTHNRVLNLGQGRYLEVIAVDPDAPVPAFPRWFALDNPDLQAALKIKPRLIAWVARTRAIDRLALADRQHPLHIRPMQRGRLRWRFAFTADGSLPGDGLIPYLIQWESATHPTETMPDADCRLLTLAGMHPYRERIQRVLAAMGLVDAIALHPTSGQRSPGLAARIATPGGVVMLV